MPGSQTTPGPTGARNNAPADFAFRQVNNVGNRVDNGFAAQWLAYTLPYRRFADVLADACARIGGDVGCYSFIAVDFHHILLASLPAHSLTLRPAGLLNRLKRPLSRGSSPAGYPAEPLVSYQINRQLSGWNLPPLVIRAFGAHCQMATLPTTSRLCLGYWLAIDVSDASGTSNAYTKPLGSYVNRTSPLSCLPSVSISRVPKLRFSGA